MLREGEETGGISSAREFSAKWKEHTYWEGMWRTTIPILLFAGAVGIVGLGGAFLKERDPLLFTGIGEGATVGHSEGEIKFIRIANKKVNLGILHRRIHLIIRKLGEYTGISFVGYFTKGRGIRSLMDMEFEVVPMETVLMTKRQWGEFSAFMEKNGNPGKNGNIRASSGRVIEIGGRVHKT
jgi:hypothetical protein